jgi:hypothetical protein
VGSALFKISRWQRRIGSPSVEAIEVFGESDAVDDTRREEIAMISSAAAKPQKPNRRNSSKSNKIDRRNYEVSIQNGSIGGKNSSIGGTKPGFSECFIGTKR